MASPGGALPRLSRELRHGAAAPCCPKSKEETAIPSTSWCSAAVERGHVVRVEVVGVLLLRDSGEEDSKLLAVPRGTPLGECEDLEELESRFPGVTRIVETWFTHYKGPGRMESRGLASREDALALLARAVGSFEAAHGDED